MLTPANKKLFLHPPFPECHMGTGDATISNPVFGGFKYRSSRRDLGGCRCLKSTCKLDRIHLQPGLMRDHQHVSFLWIFSDELWSHIRHLNSNSSLFIKPVGQTAFSGHNISLFLQVCFPPPLSGSTFKSETFTNPQPPCIFTTTC